MEQKKSKIEGDSIQHFVETEKGIIWIGFENPFPSDEIDRLFPVCDLGKVDSQSNVYYPDGYPTGEK